MNLVVAKIYPDREHGGRWRKSVKNTEFPISSASVSHARTVLASLPQVADPVLAPASGHLTVSPTFANCDVPKAIDG
jgi:hypothetical protein